MITEGPPSDSASLTVQYRDGTGVAKKSFFYRISVLDSTTGAIKVDIEPLKGDQKKSIQFMFKEPLVFPK